MKLTKVLLTTFFVLLACAGWSDVKLNPIFTDHMVLQRNHATPVYGTADPGEKVTVEFAGQVKTAITDSSKHWKVLLVPMPASSNPRKLVVRSSIGNQQSEIVDVLVGDVWLCAGQSNMATEIRQYPTLREAKAEMLNNPLVRLFKFKRNGIGAKEPSNEVVLDAPFQNSWQKMTPAMARGFSATGAFFGNALQPMAGIPIGLLSANRGGTAVNQWLPMEFMQSKPDLYAPFLGPDNPWWKESKRNPGLIRAPSHLFNGTIHPIIPFAIRGCIWYQGESDDRYSDIYGEMVSDLIQVWRGLWGYDFPFLFVQLAPYDAVAWDNRGEAWAFQREAQDAALALSNTARAVIIDSGEQLDIHPQNKQPVGRRLALLAAHLDKPEIAAYSPEFDSAKIADNKIHVTFKYAGSGLETRRVAMNKNRRMEPGTDTDAFVVKADTLAGFTICGSDKKFVKAQAKITGPDTVDVWADGVAKPVAVRYGWADFPLCNLYNKEGLPASPFRTDSFPAPDFTSLEKPVDADFYIRNKRVSFKDDFDVSKGWISSSPTTAQWNISGGSLTVGQTTSTDYVYFNPATRIEGGEKLDLQSTISSPWKTVWGGLAFNYRDAGNFDALRIKFGTPQYQMLRFEDGKLVDVLDSGSAKIPFSVNGTYLLHFRAVSGSGAFSVEISDAATGEALLKCAKTIPDLGSIQGCAGLYGANSNGNTTLFTFDDFMFMAGE